MDSYARDLFEQFCLHRETLRIDLWDVCQNEIEDKFGFEPFFKVLFDEELKFADLQKVLGLFECATELMEYIYDGLSAIKGNLSFRKLTMAMTIPMVDVNDVCTAKHKLTPFVTDRADWWACDL